MKTGSLIVLAVDDNQDYLRLLQAGLREALPEAELVIATDGRQGLEQARARDPDVILLDLVMPGMDGYEVCRQLKADDQLHGIPVLVLSAIHVDRASRLAALAAGAEGFLAKPCEEPELVAQIRAMAKIKAANRLRRLEKAQLEALVAERTRELTRELTERTRTEEALRQLSARHAAILQEIPDIVMEVDADKVYTWANPSGLEFFGDDVLGHEAAHYFVRPQDTYERVQPLFNGDAATYYVESWQRRKDGQERLLGWWCQALRDADGRVTGALSTARDLTDSRRAEALMEIRLRLLEFAPEHSLGELLQKTLDEVERHTGSLVGFYHFVAPDQRTLSLGSWSTRTVEELCTAQGAGGHYDVDRAGVWVDCLHRRCPVIHNDYAALPHKKGLPPGHAPVLRELVVPIFRRDKVVAILGVGNKPTDYTEEDVLTVGYLADVAWEIAQRKRTEEEHERLQASLAQSDRLSSMGLLAAGVAHEINNPLSYVLFNLESLAADLPGLTEGMRRCHAELTARAGPEAVARALGAGQELLTGEAFDDVLGRLREAVSGAQRIKHIARSLGTFSRVERVEASPVDVRSSIEHALSMASNELRYRARVVRELADVPAVLATDGKLAQVFLNLFINAAQAIDEGQVERNEVRVRAWAEGERVCVEVRDTGHGIAPEHQEKIFEPFFTTKGVGVGSGLGLSICKSIVTGFGGEITFHSEPGRGTRFLVKLPRVPGDWRKPGEAAPAVAPARPKVRGRILVVDDEAGIRTSLARLLGREHEVVLAASGEEGQALLATDRRFDLVLCDLMMPRMSGMELHAWLAERDPALAGQVVFITGGAFLPGAAEYLARVGNLRVEKPFDSADLKRLAGELVLSARTKRAG
jgi:PAS domain S-box-containing protein